MPWELNTQHTATPLTKDANFPAKVAINFRSWWFFGQFDTLANTKDTHWMTLNDSIGVPISKSYYLIPSSTMVWLLLLYVAGLLARGKCVDPTTNISYITHNAFCIDRRKAAIPIFCAWAENIIFHFGECDPLSTKRIYYVFSQKIQIYRFMTIQCLQIHSYRCVVWKNNAFILASYSHQIFGRLPK